MPISKMTPCHYTSVEAYHLEMNSIYRFGWLFATLMFELNGRKHYGVRVGEVELLLQLDEFNKPRAFLNSCTHRQAQLCASGGHSGPIRCPYHSWVFDREGIPSGVPSKQCFSDVISDPKRFKLKEFACESVGQFIFVCVGGANKSLKDFLGNQYDFLKKISEGMYGLLDEFVDDISANWKVVIENSLEGYHVSSVHAKTLGKVEGMSRHSNAPIFFIEDSLHSHLEHCADSEWLIRFSRLERKIGKWPFRFEHYTHHLIFPNLTITSFMGYSFHIQRFDPLDAKNTRVHSRTVGVDISNSSDMGLKIMEKIHLDGNEFTRRVFLEDRDICQKVQRGIEQSDRSAILGDGIEDRILHFQNAYLNFIK